MKPNTNTLFTSHSCFDNAWLGLGDTANFNLPNPLLGRTEKDLENPGLQELRLMRHPDYLFFAAKYLLGVELLPIQALILKELWIRPFPMLVASRGFSKTYLSAVCALLKCILIPNTRIVIAGAAFRQSKFVFEYMETIWRNAPVLRSICNNASGPRRGTDQWVMYINDSTATAIPIGCLTGETLVTTDKGVQYLYDLKQDRNKIWSIDQFNGVGQFLDNGVISTYTIKTKTGLEFTGTPNHKMQIVRNNDIVWVRADDMKIGDRILVDRTERWASNYRDICDEDTAYSLGVLIADGHWKKGNAVGFATKDKEIVEIVSRFLESCPNSRAKVLTYDNVHYACGSGIVNRWFCDTFGIDRCYTKNKTIPRVLLTSSKKNMSSFIAGLMDGDGCVINDTKGCTSKIMLTNTSYLLIKQVQYILLHYGIMSTIQKWVHKNNWSDRYNLILYGKNAKKYMKYIGFRLKRKQEKFQEALSSCDHVDTIPINIDDMINFVKEFGYKSNPGYVYPDLALCKLYRRKTISYKLVNRFLEKYGHINHMFINQLKALYNPNYYYDVITDISFGKSLPTYDINVPKNNTYCANGFISHNSGEKIRGLRANVLQIEEFGSINPEIFEVVLAGFTVVTADPVSNVKESARREAMTEAGVWSEQQEESYMAKTGNQIVLSGTASYDFEHFADYWRKYKAIITSRGNEDKLREILDGDVPPHFNWKDYSIMRIPYELIPEGFMDDTQIGRAKATMHSGTYGREYGAVFVKDSNGFFKRTLIESCVANDKTMKKEHWPSWCPQKFEAVLRGRSDKKYVYGIDPASEQDNFSIIILELWADHTRIVYGWSTNRKDFRQRLKAGLVSDHDFYGFGARKIRDLMRIFPCEVIGIDAQGGGIAVEEALHDPDKLHKDEIPIWPIIDPNKEKDTDDYPGLHILEMCQFAKAEWVADANHGLRKDFEDKVLLLPYFDSISLGLAVENDKRQQEAFEKTHDNQTMNIYDSLEDCVMEIEELKNELSTIVMTKAGIGVGGRDRWSTPEVKLPGGKKGRLRKDRYSALLIANMIARQINRTPPQIEYELMGGASHQIGKIDGKMYQGPEWFTSNMNEGTIFGIRH